MGTFWPLEWILGNLELNSLLVRQYLYFLGGTGLFFCCDQKYWSSSGFMNRPFGVVFAFPRSLF